MNRLHKIEGLLAAGGIVLLNLTVTPQSFTSALPIAPVLAQSTPTDNNPRITDPAPTQDDNKALSPLWLLLPVLGGFLLWAFERRSRSIATDDPIVDDDRVEPITQKASASSETFPDEQPSIPSNGGQHLNSFPAEARSFVPTNNHHQDNGRAASQQVNETIQLLEERLVVDLRQRKVGELIVRKEIETQIVEIPIRREKLIVEQVSPKFKQLAVIDLSPAQQIDPVKTHQTGFLPTVEAKFNSPTAAIEFLHQVADRFAQTEPVSTNSGLHQIHINIVLADAEALAVYQHLSVHDSDRFTNSVTD